MMERSSFLMLGKVTFEEHANVLERYCKGDIAYTFPKLKVDRIDHTYHFVQLKELN